LLLLLVGIGGVFLVRQHRERVSKRFEHVIAAEERTPVDVSKIKHELSEMDLTREALQKELDGRLKLVTGLKSEDFYLSIDTAKRKFRFYYGDTVLREGDVQIGDSKTIEHNGEKWTFVPLKGAFPVEGKAVDYAWQVPKWLSPNGETIPGGLGKYVLFLPNGYVIHSPPPESSPLKGAKPGSFMVSEDDLRAIWERIQRGKTQVYIF
jgi:hypothetical protein